MTGVVSGKGTRVEDKDTQNGFRSALAAGLVSEAAKEDSSFQPGEEPESAMKPKKYFRVKYWDKDLHKILWRFIKIEYPEKRPKYAPLATIFNIEDDLTAVYLSDVCRPELHIRETILGRER